MLNFYPIQCGDSRLACKATDFKGNHQVILIIK